MDRTAIVILPLALIVVAGIWYYTSRDSQLESQSEASVASGEEQTTPPPALNTLQEQITNTNASSPSEPSSPTIMRATLHTNKGDILIELSKADAPNTVANFIRLAQDKFYDGTKFHRVIANFMVQGGDPLTKDDGEMARWGTGGPGYKFADEIHANNLNNKGTIAMANAGPGTNGSQFFINVADNNFLDTKHTVFGKVISGMDTVEAMSTVEVGENDRPISPIVIQSISLQ